jgi:hypothetical protein
MGDINLIYFIKMYLKYYFLLNYNIMQNSEESLSNNEITITFEELYYKISQNPHIQETYIHILDPDTNSMTQRFINEGNDINTSLNLSLTMTIALYLNLANIDTF